MPLRELLGIIDPPPPFPGRQLQHLSTLVVNAVLARRRRRFHWLYLPEATLSFLPGRLLPRLRPGTGYLEKTIAPRRGLTPAGCCAKRPSPCAATGMIAQRERDPVP